MSGSDELAEVQSRLDLSRNPWRAGDGVLEYHPDFEALGQLLSVPVLAGATTQSGRAAKAVDAWVAHEFRRAGFDPDAVWPRAAAPSVLPRDIRDLLIALPSQVEKEVARRLPEMRSIAPRDGRFLGRAYVKQVDVSMSHWSTGPELLISTKMMTASFGKNLSNRFEEAYGDAGNLRARYPLAAVGFLFVLHASILKEERSSFVRAVDMMRKLRDHGDGNGYTATSLLLVDWDTNGGPVTLNFPPPDKEQVDPSGASSVPDDLSAGQFFAALIHQILDAAPVTFHEQARQKINAAVPGIEL